MSKIEWTGETWNPVVGCEKVSAGCKNCYAINMTNRLQAIPASKDKYQGLVSHTGGGQLNWTGVVRCVPEALRKPLNTKKPTVWFVNSMSDLFHDDVPFDFIDKVFAVMALCPQHTFQILTKRAERMAKYFEYKDTRWVNEGMQGDERIRYQCYHEFGGEIKYEDWKWPLPNVWLGVSVENQESADKRIPELLKSTCISKIS